MQNGSKGTTTSKPPTGITAFSAPNTCQHARKLCYHPQVIAPKGQNHLTFASHLQKPQRYLEVVDAEWN
eukprot:3024759-Amphidinium_carterae.1